MTEKLLNHVSGTTGGIVAVYQRHSYEDEMRMARAGSGNTQKTSHRPTHPF